MPETWRGNCAPGAAHEFFFNDRIAACAAQERAGVFNNR
jgi:hypothetical protein